GAGGAVGGGMRRGGRGRAPTFGEEAMADDLWRQGASELAEAIARKQVSCREVMESVTRRIRDKNPALNAIVYDYTDEALAEARRADEEIAAGRLRGPLHGVPVTIKENVDQRGKTTPNSLAELENLVPTHHAP